MTTLSPPSRAMHALDVGLALLAADKRCAGVELPDPLAARVGVDTVSLVLAEPAEPIPPWRGDSTCWNLSIDHPVEESNRGHAPFPAFATVGTLPSGDLLLLDLERIGVLSITADSPAARQHAAGLFRGLAADLARNAWSDDLEIALVGMGEELCVLNPERLTYAPSFAAVADRVEVRLDAADAWAPQIVVLTELSQPGASGDRLDALASALSAGGGRRRGVGLVVLGECRHARWSLRVDAHGTFAVPALHVADAKAHEVAGDPARCTLGADLDTDLAAWDDDSSPRPKVRVLGAVTVTAAGRKPERKRALCTELITYLATRRAGVTAEDLSAAIWPDDQPTPGYRRTVLSLARRWLGTEGGRWFLPHRADGADRYSGTYGVDGVLLDWDLFQRLCARSASGNDPRTDLVAALRLVAGAPFVVTRVRGYGWLVEDGLEHAVVGAVLDAAHQLVDLSLAAGDPSTAAWAAERARACDPRQLSDTPLLDSVRVAMALGDVERARALVRHLIDVRQGASVEEDLAPATFATLDELGLVS